jgi:hypothetical protein
MAMICMVCTDLVTGLGAELAVTVQGWSHAGMYAGAH